MTPTMLQREGILKIHNSQDLEVEILRMETLILENLDLTSFKGLGSSKTTIKIAGFLETFKEVR